MPTTIRPIRTLVPLGLLALAAACTGGADDNLAAIDNELLANGADPALTSALEDQILVDPNLVQQAHPNSVRPPESPAQAQYPAGSASSGAPAAQARLRNAGAITGGDQPSACGVPFNFDAQYARRLPSEFPFYPGGRLTEAAGSDSGNCQARVVTFTTPDAHQRVLDHYRTLATRAGYSAEHQVRGADHVLAGVNARTNGAYFLIVTPGRPAAEVALIYHNGG